MEEQNVYVCTYIVYIYAERERERERERELEREREREKERDRAREREKRKREECSLLRLHPSGRQPAVSIVCNTVRDAVADGCKREEKKREEKR